MVNAQSEPPHHHQPVPPLRAPYKQWNSLIPVLGPKTPYKQWIVGVGLIHEADFFPSESARSQPRRTAHPSTCGRPVSDSWPVIA